MLDARDDSNRAKYFVSSSVPHLFEILKGILKNRIEDGYTFYLNWHCFVAFSVFVLRCVHYQTDEKAYDLIKLAIDDYLRGNSVGVDSRGMLCHSDKSNYVNYFGDGRTNKDMKTDNQLIDETLKLYELFVTVWNDNFNVSPHTKVEYCFANNFKVEREDMAPNFSSSFHELFREYSLNGDQRTIKLFNCRRSPSDKPRFLEQKDEGFKIT